MRFFIIFVKIELCERKTWCYFRNLLYLCHDNLFSFPPKQALQSSLGFFCYHMQRYINFMTLAIKSLSLFELICDYPYIDRKSVSRCRNTPSSGTAKSPHRKCHKQATHAVYLFRYAQHERYAYNSSVFLYANLAVSTKGGKVITPNWGPSPKRVQNY